MFDALILVFIEIVFHLHIEFFINGYDGFFNNKCMIILIKRNVDLKYV